MTAITTATGRYVWGDLFKSVPVTDDKGVPKLGKDGLPMVEFNCFVAFNKTDPAWLAFKRELKALDAAAFPQYHVLDPATGAQMVKPGVAFADKIDDGDGLNKKGEPRAAPGNGYAGCDVLRFTTQYAPTVFGWNGSAWAQIVDPAAIKLGDYIQVSGDTKANTGASPGMYRNFDKVALYGAGERVIPKSGGLSAAEAFKAPPSAPTVAAGVALAPPQAGVPVAPPAPAAPAAPPAPVAAGPVMTAKANGASYESLVAAGWTDALLVEHGMMAPPAIVTPPAAPAVPVGSYTAHLAPPPAPAAPAAPPAPVAAGPVMTAKANGASYESLVAAGWTDALLVEHGMMTA